MKTRPTRLLALAASVVVAVAACAPRNPTPAPATGAWASPLPPTSCAQQPLGTDTTVYTPDQVDEQPVRRGGAVRPSYPLFMLRRAWEGRAVFSVLIRRDGTVDPVALALVQASDPLLESAVRPAIQAALYWPACRDGHPVSMRAHVNFNFIIARSGGVIADGLRLDSVRREDARRTP